MFCCYAGAQDLLSLRLVSPAWRRSADDDKTWIWLRSHDLLPTHSDFTELVEFVSNHRRFYWQARYLKEDVHCRPWDFPARLRDWPRISKYSLLPGADWLHVEIYTVNHSKRISLKTDVFPEIDFIAATFPKMTVPVGGY